MTTVIENIKAEISENNEAEIDISVGHDTDLCVLSEVMGAAMNRIIEAESRKKHDTGIGVLVERVAASNVVIRALKNM